MERLTLQQIAEAVEGQIINQVNSEVQGVSIDSRTLEKGQLFVAIQGENFDGHDFLDKAIEKGASAVLISEDRGLNLSAIIVEDTTKALQDLACYYRKKFEIPVIAVTGSTGKTTTKDMIAAVLGEEYKTLKTKGNFNNEIGLPLTIFELDSSYEAVVLEMGMRALGEIKELADIAVPDIGVITNVGLTHIEILKSAENIARAKSELVSALTKEGTAILNGDDVRVKTMSSLTEAKVINYGLNKYNNIRAERIEILDGYKVLFILKGEGNLYDEEIILPLPGKYNVYNALAAIAVGLELGISLKKIKTGLYKLKLTSMRNEIIESEKGFKIINDTYNANPTSVRVAIETLDEITDRGKILVLGDMLELGELAIKEHYNIGKLVAQKKIDYLFTFGSLAKEIANGAKNSGMKEEKIYIFENKRILSKKVLDIATKGDTILIKGSRGMKLEEVSKVLEEGRE